MGSALQVQADKSSRQKSRRLASRSLRSRAHPPGIVLRRAEALHFVSVGFGAVAFDPQNTAASDRGEFALIDKLAQIADIVASQRGGFFCCEPFDRVELIGHIPAVAHRFLLPVNRVKLSNRVKRSIVLDRRRLLETKNPIKMIGLYTGHDCRAGMPTWQAQPQSLLDFSDDATYGDDGN